MALNSFVTRDGLEMGRAQVVQAQAAGVEPDVRMNPILLKPSSDVGSQVIVNGEVRGDMPAREYFRHKKALIPDILRAYDSLADEFDIIVIEGAGSPAEINLKADDIVNMGLASWWMPRCCWRGTLTAAVCLPSCTAPWRCWKRTSVRASAGLSSINSVETWKFCARPCHAGRKDPPAGGGRGAVSAGGRGGRGLSGTAPAEQSRRKAAGCGHCAAAAHLQLYGFYAVGAAPAAGCAVCSWHAGAGRARFGHSARHKKNTVHDLLWLRQSGLEAAVLKYARGGTPVLGVCGGYQMLGETLDDTHGTEGGRPQTLRGLGLLPTRTVFTAEKRRTQVTATATPPFAGAALTGYEIHTGRTAVQGAPFCRYADGTPEGCVQGNVFGTYLHGLFDSGELTARLADYLCARRGLAAETAAPSRWLPTASSSLICWRTACARRWIWTPSMPPWGLPTPKGSKKMTPQHHLPADIERTSMGIITAELAARGLEIPPENAAVVKRVIHTTADFDYAENLRFTPGAVAAGLAAVRGGTIITDTNMALAGITKPGLARLGGQALCFMADPTVAAAAKADGTTRAVAAMHKAAREYPGAVLAVGNAPHGPADDCRGN